MFYQLKHKVNHICSIFIAAFITIPASAEIPVNYYQSVDESTPESLRNSLHQIIKGHTKIPYTSSSIDTWDVLEQADEDPNNSNNVIDVYKNASYRKVGGGNSNYNREHSWPKSYGFPNNVSSNYPYTDMHHLFIANGSYNSSRSNKPYADCTSCNEKVTLLNDGRGGSATESNWTVGSFESGSWETWEGRKGDVARALMYMAIRYEGGSHAVTGHTEPDLILTDDRSLIGASNTGSNIAVAYMGLRAELIDWSREDPVDDYELRHNEVVFTYQGNRNPFIDHPEYIACVFEEICSGNGGGTPPPASTNAWINEIHYDNRGGDVNESVEILAPAATNLLNWRIEAYNGNNSSLYKTVELSGTVPDQQNGFGSINFNIKGIQNGSADGLALINPQGEVVQFLSYEGTLVAQNGSAEGMESTDIGVMETNSTQSGYSLQLSGHGQEYSDFIWQSPMQNSRGSINHNQSF